MFGIAQIDISEKPEEIGFPVEEPQVGDIGLLFADQCANPSQNAGIVADGEIECHGIDRRVFPRLPVQIEPALRLILKIHQGCTINSMHHHATAAIGDSDDAFARQRLTAGGHGALIDPQQGR